LAKLCHNSHPIEEYGEKSLMNDKSILTSLVVLGVLLALAGGLSACNTVKGAGQDLKAAGQAIERKAEQKKHY